MILEMHEIITPDGVTYDLNDGYAHFVLKTPSGMGLPGVTPLTLQNGQQGLFYRDYLLQPRELVVQIRYQGCSRLEYWSQRMDLLQALRPNRLGELTYVFSLEDGTRYAIKGICAGLPFQNEVEGWDEWGFNEVITLICNDPIWFSADLNTVAIEKGGVAHLIFPITFPIQFQSHGTWGETVVNYTGTWYSYPIFYVRGPFSSVMFTHVEKNVIVKFNRAFGSSQQITFDLGAREIYTTVGETDLFGWMNSQSNIVDFRIEPDPIVPGGVNTITVDIENPGEEDVADTTRVYMTYYTKWIGI